MMINRVSIVLANYCPHCVPFSLRNAAKIANDLGVPLRVLDIEISDQETIADKLIEEHGDWSEDYLIPQVFLEYEDGRVAHLLTGFSETISATEASWEALFSSSYYRDIVYEQAAKNHQSLEEFVHEYLSFRGRCRRHCDKSTSLVELWYDTINMVGAYVCPSGYVSRVIYFSRDPDIQWFKQFLSTQAVEEMLNDRDLRPATRHGWELGSKVITNNTTTSLKEVSEVYWTPYPKTDKERRRGLFLCSEPQKEKGCKTLFVQDVNSPHRLCQKCR